MRSFIIWAQSALSISYLQANNFLDRGDLLT
jgi:hypothetical protein